MIQTVSKGVLKIILEEHALRNVLANGGMVSVGNAQITDCIVDHCVTD